MKLTQKYNFKHLRKIVPILGLGVAAATFSPGCSDGEEGLIKNQPPMPTTPETPSTPTTPEIQKHDAVLVIETRTPISKFFYELDSLLADPTVDQVYVEPPKEFIDVAFLPENVAACRYHTLQPALERSPRVHGRGNFIFRPGLASAVPEDSLWYVANGWTINQHLQEQNQKQK